MIVRKALGTLIREALEARGLPVIITYAADGALRYEIGGTLLSPGEAAKYLGVDW